MNLNKLIKDTLKPIGLPIEQDEYTDTEDKYIIFAYEDERPVLFGNNKPRADTAYIQLQLITPKNFDYLEVKEKIRNLLEEAGFIVSSVQSFLGDTYQKTEKKRQTVYELSYTEGRMEE